MPRPTSAPKSRPPSSPERFAPRAAGEMAKMFDEVSPRYDLLNRMMTLGQDSQWRAAMWRAVPEPARVVLDLCTGNGVSLPGLRRPGRLVIGADVSLGMLHAAQEEEGRAGWAPRLACADAFRLPFRDRSIDAVTIAFGLRNLRPRPAALAEIARVLVPGGVVAILEGTPPEPGPLAPLHRFHLAHVVPWLGRLSPDPSAYSYLGRSILEFGPAARLEAELDSAGFEMAGRRSFLLGASRLWVARRAGASGTGNVQDAIRNGTNRGDLPNSRPSSDWEWRIATGTQLAISAAILVALGVALQRLIGLPSSGFLTPGQRVGAITLSIAGILGFAVRSLLLTARLLGPRAPR